MSVKATELVAYGILNEESDIRAHVSVVNQTIYVFQTKAAVAALQLHEPRLVKCFQPGVDGATSEGWPMPMEWIGGLRACNAKFWEGWANFTDRTTMPLDRRGHWAVQCVLYAMRCGRFPFWIDAEEEDRASIQIQGVDILVVCRKRVQVKCDWIAGARPLGSGNLFLQKTECNPLKLH